jgi:hypothetical protein
MEMWKSFAQNAQGFGNAFEQTQAAAEEIVEDDETLEALSLPHLRSFVNTRL